MTIANLGTLLRMFEDLTPLARKHLIGYMLQCTPETRRILQTFHRDNELLHELLRRMQEFGIHPPTLAPGLLPEDGQ